MLKPFLTSDKPELDTLFNEADAFSGLGDLEARLAGATHHRAQSPTHWKLAEDSCRKSLDAWQKVPANRQERYTRSLAEQDPNAVAGKLRRCKITESDSE